jgi:uncharacterized protein YfkK (UPF0435 family)
MTIQYLIWAVLNKGDLAPSERQAIADYLRELEGGKDE